MESEEGKHIFTLEYIEKYAMQAQQCKKGISNREFDTVRLLETYAFAYGLIRSVVQKISNLSIIVCLDHLGI